ncbi:unnamed protein product, partial [Owenia fusiformis]
MSIAKDLSIGQMIANANDTQASICSGRFNSHNSMEMNDSRDTIPDSEVPANSAAFNKQAFKQATTSSPKDKHHIKSASTFTKNNPLYTIPRKPKHTLNIIDAMGLGLPTNIGNNPNATRQADPALLTRLRTSIHWEARHDGVLKSLNNCPGGIPRGLIPNIKCGAPEKETSDIEKAFDV